MHTFFDFLAFNTFITGNVLIVFYYIGALLIPIVLYRGRKYFLSQSRILRSFSEFITESFSSLGNREQLALKILVIALFLMMELFWRMMFEAMIGYFQMHDFLQKLSLSQH